MRHFGVIEAPSRRRLERSETKTSKRPDGPNSNSVNCSDSSPLANTDSRNVDSRKMDSRNMEMKRADALTAIAAEFLSSNSKKIERAKRPISINVTVDLPTLLGLAENPGELEGHGPIPAVS